MELIKPSATIIEDQLQGMTICQRIDSCAATCYQRPPKSTDDDAQKFCKQYGIETGHGAMLEFAVLSLVLPGPFARSLAAQKYFLKTQLSEDQVCFTGSIRAWMEGDDVLMDYIREHFLAYYYPLFFGEPHLGKSDTVRFAQAGEVPMSHTHVAVRFIVSRAITHELVRHRPCGFLQESQRYCNYKEGITFIQPQWAVEGSPFFYAFADDCDDCERAYIERSKLGLSPQQSRGALNNDVKADIVVYTHLAEWDHVFGLRCSAAPDPEMRRVMIPLRDDFHAKYPSYPWKN